MNPQEYGIFYTQKREKALVDELNTILSEVFSEYGAAKLSKCKSAIILEARLPFVYKHFYFRWVKKYGVFLELYPNTDETGRKKFPDSDASWVLFVNPADFYTDETGTLIHTPNPAIPQYIHTILNRLSAPTELLYTYADGEERL